MNENAALIILLALMLVGLVGWLGLGGLDESSKWNFPPEAIEFFDFMTKSTFGALMTILARRRVNGRRSSGSDIS